MFDLPLFIKPPLVKNIIIKLFTSGIDRLSFENLGRTHLLMLEHFSAENDDFGVDDFFPCPICIQNHSGGNLEAPRDVINDILTIENVAEMMLY